MDQNYDYKFIKKVSKRIKRTIQMFVRKFRKIHNFFLPIEKEKESDKEI